MTLNQFKGIRFFGESITTLLKWVGGTIVAVSAIVVPIVKGNNEYKDYQETKRMTADIYRRSSLWLQFAKTQEQLLERITFLEASNKFMMTQIPGAYWISDSTGKTVEVGHNLYEITGRTESELMEYGWFAFVHPDDKKRVGEEIEGARNRRTNFYSVFRMVKPNGKSIPIRSTSIKVEYNGRIINYIGTLNKI